MIKTRISVLLVDDLPANLLSVGALLEDQSIEVLKAGSGMEALELLLANDVALALVDVQMPEMDGFELAELMRGSDRTRHVPIIFVTAGGADSQRRFRGYEAGAVDFIYKPIEPHVLRSKVNVFGDLYRQRQQIAAQRDQLAASTQALLEADRAKDRFLAMLAHELRNPVAALMSGVDLLDRPRGAEQRAMIQSRMMRMVTHLSRLLEDLLDISRVTEGKVSLRMNQVKLMEVISFALEGCQHNIEAKGHKLVLDISFGKTSIYADFARLAQVISNLLNNAAKYTPPGGTITLSGRVQDEEIVISVSDSGIGIPVDMQVKIFDVFAQVELHRVHSQGGLGIGLALVKRLVSLHGGSVQVLSEGSGKGSTFVIRLPQAANTALTEQA